MPQYDPKINEEKTSWYDHFMFAVFVTAIVTSFVVLIWNYPWILILIAISLFSVDWSGEKYERFLLKKAKDREGHDIGTFARSFDYRKVDTWVIRAVYEQIQTYISSETTKIPILAQDNLCDDLDIHADDLELDLMDEIAQRAGRTFEDCENNPYYEKIETVSDIVFYFCSQPKEIKNT